MISIDETIKQAIIDAIIKSLKEHFIAVSSYMCSSQEHFIHGCLYSGGGIGIILDWSTCMISWRGISGSLGSRPRHIYIGDPKCDINKLGETILISLDDWSPLL